MIIGRRLSCAAVFAGMLAGCGGTVPQAAPEDTALARDQRLARLSLEQQRPEQAVALYRQALTQAQLRDDLAAIASVGYELAVALLRTGRAGEALVAARDARAEIGRRGGKVRPELMLVEAAALYRTGDGTQAASLAEVIVATPDASAETQGRAGFVGGLVAADRGDISGIEQALTRLDAAGAASPAGAFAADRDELVGRLALLRGDPSGAQVAFVSAADARRTMLDYPGMARALAHAAAAAEAQGRGGDAADLYLRAGRTAQINGQTIDARVWLGRARHIAGGVGAADIGAEATARLAVLEAGASEAQPVAQPSRVPGGSG